MSLPPLTSLQYLVLSTLLPGEMVGSKVRAALEQQGEKKGGPAFYQMMGRFEEAGFVEGRYSQEIVGGQMIRERWYAVTKKGVDAWRETRDFYANLAKDIRRDGDPPSEGESWVTRVPKPNRRREK
jgi:DNA-binding PadR family transcriptional regulator